MKYHKVFIGVLNNKNIEKIEEIRPVAKTCVVLFSNLNFFELSKKQLENIREKNIIVIPNEDNIRKANKNKKSINYALFVDWLLKQPKELKLLLQNDSLLYLANKDDDWHDQYDGGHGYAVTIHAGGEPTTFYGHSVSITDSSDKLILKEFNGFSLKNT